MILVYDDIDLPLGTVRVRKKGSHGGHNGVRSVIDALGTQDIKRVKVGVGRPDHKGDVPDHVLTSFEHDELPVVDAAVADAVEKVLALLG
jgi:PTH1 family peptidyl-tRNA hydrolase